MRKQSQLTPIASVKAFGFWTATSLVLGNMIGSGVFFIPASLAALGPISIIGWIITAIGASSLAYVFAKLTQKHPDAGGPYTHTRRTFGNLPGFLMAWGYWTTSWSSNAAIALAFTSYLSHFLPLLESPLLTFTAAASLIWGTTLINCTGLRNVGFVQVVTVIVKLIPLVIVGLIGPFYIDFSHFFPLKLNNNYSDIQTIMIGASLTMWAFTGLESATVPATNVRNPEKTIPKATIFGTTFGAIIYVTTTIVLFGLIPATDLQQSTAPFVDATIRLFGPTAAPIIGCCVLISIFGGLNGWILFIGQVPLSMAKDGLFPQIFRRTNKKGIPVIGLIFSSSLTTILLCLNLDKSLLEQFNTIILVGAMLSLFAYLLTAFAAVKISLQEKYMTPKLLIAIILGSAYVFWAILGAGSRIICICAIAYLCGLPVYWFTRQQITNNQLQNKEECASD